MSPPIENLYKADGSQSAPLTAAQQAVMNEAAQHHTNALRVIGSPESTVAEREEAERFLADQRDNLNAGIQLGVLSAKEFIALRTVQAPETPPS